MRTDERSFSDYLAMLRRRWKLAAGVGVLVFVGFVMYAFLQTAIYEAIAVIQIERPAIPATVVQAGSIAAPEEMLASVTQRVLTTETISGLIGQYDLYPALRGKVAPNDLAALFRANAGVTPSKVDTPTRYGRPAAVTYAFTVSFRYEDAGKSAEIANEIARLHVVENSTLRAGTAARTSAFLEAESEKITKRLAEIQSQINALQGTAGGVLAADDPMMAAQRYEQLDRELAQVDASLRAARERKEILETELLQTPRYRAVMGDGQPALRGQDRLIVAQQELVALQAKYSPDHPDIVRLKREIAALTGGTVDYNLLASQLQTSIAATEEQLAAARQTYSDDHPDAVRLRRSLVGLQQQLAEVLSLASRPAAQAPPDNPMYIQLQTRIRTAEIEVAELSTRRAQLYSRLRQYSYNPEIESKYGPLARERDLLQQQYGEIREKYTQASLAESVESDNQGQILTVVEPAPIPTAPVEPNRIMLIFLGFVLGLAGAFGTASLADAVDTTVRGSRDIEMLLRMAPIALIPYIDGPAEVLQRRRMRVISALLALTALVLAFMAFS